MATVKEVKVDAIVYNPICRYYAWTSKTFKTFTDDKGDKSYYIDGEQVSKEEGNEKYLSLKRRNAEYQQTKDCKDYIKREWASYYRWKKDSRYRKQFPDAKYTLHEADTFKQEVKEYEISYEEIIEKLEASIDKYVEYIDNGRQYEEACKRNAEIRAEIKKYEKLIAER